MKHKRQIKILDKDDRCISEICTKVLDKHAP